MTLKKSILRCRPLDSKVWGPLVVVIMLSFLAPCASLAQFKSIHGVLGGMLEQEGYFYPTTQSTYSRYRQMIDVEIAGYIYHPNLLDFTLQTQFMNTNTLINNLSANTKQHEMYFSFYNLNGSMFKITNFPLFIYARRNLNTTKSDDEFLPTFYNEILTTEQGFRWSPQIKGLPRMTFLYDDYASKGTNPLAPLDQRNRNLQLTLELFSKSNSNIGIDLLQRKRTDNVSKFSIITNEVHLRSFARIGEVHQLSANANFWNEQNVSSLNANAFLSSQFDSKYNNQVAGQFRFLTNPFATNLDAGIRDQLDVVFSPSWRGIFSTSHSEGFSRSLGTLAPTNATSISVGTNYQEGFSSFQTNITAQATYQQSQTAVRQRSLEGMLSAGVRTNTLRIGQISLSNQTNMRRWSASQDILLTVLQNATSATIESNAISNLFLRGNGTYAFAAGFGSTSYGGDEVRLSFLQDLIYQWTFGVNILFTLHYGFDRVSRAGFTNSVQRYSAAAQTSSLIRNLTIRAFAAKTEDAISGLANYNYEVDALYSWHALRFGLRFVTYALSTQRRGDFYFTVSRPFSFDLDNSFDYQ